MRWLIVCTLLFLCAPSKAQFSLMEGGNYSDVRHNNLLPGKRPVFGFFTGFSLQYYPFVKSDRLSVVNEFFYHLKGFRQDFKTDQFKHPLHYLAFPVLLNYDISSRLSVHTGCEFSLLITANSLNENKNRRNEVYRGYDFGWNAGTGFYLLPGRVMLFSRFHYGLLPQMDYYQFDELGNMTPIKDVKNINVMVGLKIILGDEKIFPFR